MRPSRRITLSASATNSRLGTAVSDERRNARARVSSGVQEFKNAQRHECGSGRAAEPRVAVDQDRRLFVPALNEIKQLRDMARAGKHQIGLRLDDVIHVELEMTVAEDRCWRLRYEIGVYGTDEMACAGLLDHLRNVSQGADVNARRLADFHERSLLIWFRGGG